MHVSTNVPSVVLEEGRVALGFDRTQAMIRRPYNCRSAFVRSSFVQSKARSRPMYLCVRHSGLEGV